MIVAYAMAHSSGFSLLLESNPDLLLFAQKFTSEIPFPYMVMTMLVLFFGPGAWSVDRLLCKGKWS
jgi:uncharacterized membrane protein YphA (DoxX/SURF4 family)